MDNKICPLIFAFAHEGTDCTCKGEKCAWWNGDGKTCAILDINRELSEIRDRTPSIY